MNNEPPTPQGSIRFKGRHIKYSASSFFELPSLLNLSTALKQYLSEKNRLDEVSEFLCKVIFGYRQRELTLDNYQ